MLPGEVDWSRYPDMASTDVSCMYWCYRCILTGVFYANESRIESRELEG